MNVAAEVERDRQRRLLNQRSFPGSFVTCPCEGGCLLCAYTGLISKAEAKRTEHGGSMLDELRGQALSHQAARNLTAPPGGIGSLNRRGGS